MHIGELDVVAGVSLLLVTTWTTRQSIDMDVQCILAVQQQCRINN